MENTHTHTEFGQVKVAPLSGATASRRASIGCSSRLSTKRRCLC